MEDNASQAVSANVELNHPPRWWIKQNVEDKGTHLKNVPATACVPSTQPDSF